MSRLHWMTLMAILLCSSPATAGLRISGGYQRDRFSLSFSTGAVVTHGLGFRGLIGYPYFGRFGHFGRSGYFGCHPQRYGYPYGAYRYGGYHRAAYYRSESGGLASADSVLVMPSANDVTSARVPASRPTPRPLRRDDGLGAYSYLRIGQPGKAQHAFAERCRADAGDAEALVGYALASAMRGDEARAVEGLRRAVRVDAAALRRVPTDAPMAQALGRLMARYARSTARDGRLMLAAAACMAGEHERAAAALDGIGEGDEVTAALRAAIVPRHGAERGVVAGGDVR